MFCFCQSIGYLLPVSAGLGGFHSRKQLLTFGIPQALIIVGRHVVIVSHIGEYLGQITPGRSPTGCSLFFCCYDLEVVSSRAGGLGARPPSPFLLPYYGLVRITAATRLSFKSFVEVGYGFGIPGY